MDKIKLIERAHLKKELPNFKVGDTVKVYVKLVEEEKTRLQAYEGIVIAKKGTGVKETFIVRRISYGEGVERTFLIHSPFLDKVEVVKKGDVKRSKLYYLREKIGKETKIEEKIEEVGLPEDSQPEPGEETKE